MTFSVLVVCAANVCRSQTAVVVARHRLSELGPVGVVSVSSAGTSAENGMPWCATSRDWLAGHGYPSEASEVQPSRAVSVDLLAAADLVLAADRDTSNRLLRLSPVLRPRLFSLTQAAALAASIAAPNERDLAAPGVVSQGKRDRPRSERALRELVAQMGALRGRVTAGPDRRWAQPRSWRRVTIPSADVPDPHGAGARVRHDDVVAAVTGATESLVQSIGAAAAAAAVLGSG